MRRDRLVFYLEDDPVGKFRGRAYPTRAGRVEYDPYRGQGHAELGRTLARGETPICWFRRRGERVTFTVVRKEFLVGRPGDQSHWYLDITWPRRTASPKREATARRCN
jgi:hypothetical protein